VGASTFVPLILPDPASSGRPEPRAELLDEALAQGTAALSEVDKEGVVERVRVEHHGELPLLLLDGEQVLGAKQNRIFNASFLIAPGSVVEVPVSCVEQGRWHYEETTFRASGSTLVSAARRRKLARVSRSVATGSGYDAGQREVWRDVEHYLTQTRTHSTTAALEEALASRRPELDEQLRRLAPQARQVGLALVRGGRVLLLDLLGSADLFARGWRKIGNGMLADAPAGLPEPAGAADAVQATLQALLTLRVMRRLAPGCGETLHGEAGQLALGAVVHDASVYHVVAAHA